MHVEVVLASSTIVQQFHLSLAVWKFYSHQSSESSSEAVGTTQYNQKLWQRSVKLDHFKMSSGNKGNFIVLNSTL